MGDGGTKVDSFRISARTTRIWRFRPEAGEAFRRHLETKRLAFPRFYFVSSADLLDILSNGNQPEVVMRHLTKLFDSMAKLKFKQDAQGENMKAKIQYTRAKQLGSPLADARLAKVSG